MTQEIIQALETACLSGEALPFEQMALALVQCLPGAIVERTRDVVQITAGSFSDEDGLVIVVMPDAIELRLPVLTWPGPHTPVESSKRWKRLSLRTAEQREPTALIAEAQAQQRATFRLCKFCGERNPPGWMHAQDVCQSCAEQQLGIVH